MDALKIKYINQECYVECITYEFSFFLDSLKDKLKNNFFYREGCFKAYFSFSYSLSIEKCKKLYDFCEVNKIIVLGIGLENKAKSINLLEHCFYTGENYCLYEDTIYVGDIEKDTYITTNANLYVIGEVRGNIDALFSDVEINASSFNKAQIRIFDSLYQNMTNNAPCKVYYENERIKQE